MTLVKRNSNGLIPGFFDDFISKSLLNWNSNNFFDREGFSLPTVNLKETNDAYEVEMAAPGLKKEDFKIELDNEILSISSDKQMEGEDTRGDHFIRREFSYQSFQRTFYLPKKVVESNKIEASYVDGILKVVIPKKEEAKALPPRMIEIK